MFEFSNITDCLNDRVKMPILGILMFLWMFTPVLHSQTQLAPDRYRIEFTDKNHNAYTIGFPGHFLSERALMRRARQGIAVTHADLPVSKYYTDSLIHMGFEVLNTSRWLNSATVHCMPEDIDKLRTIDFIKHASITQTKDTADTIASKVVDLESIFSFFFQKKNDSDINPQYSAPSAYYGKAADQIAMMNGQVLHNRGFRGKGMLIAVIDGGFYKAFDLSGFDSLHNNGRLRGVKCFSKDSDSPLGESDHGTNVLSIIASNLPGRMIGTAPDADYILLRSEEVGKEYLVEEDNWIAAVEYADSIGADLITSSLGYSRFDDLSQNHHYRDLDGRTAGASRAATMAAARGMIVCISAGNDGVTDWKYISVPADADSVVTIGAVNRRNEYVYFSSVGYTSDGRIKPDLMAMGKETAYQNSMGSINTGDGTSYSTPLLAGLIACLWQAYPDKNNMEIIEMVKHSSSHFQKPDSLYGYGIPDFSKLVKPVRSNETYTLSVVQNPSGGAFFLHLSPAKHGHVRIQIKTLSGQPLFSHSAYIAGCDIFELTVNESKNYSAGMYLVEAHTEAGKITAKAVKQRSYK